MEKMRILIGSCGGLTGCYLARKFKQALNCFVIGADVSIENPTKFFVDEFVKLPPAQDAEFLDCLLTVLNEKQIDLYLPTHSKEIRAIARDEQYLRKSWDGFFIVSPEETFEKLDNKKIANEYLRNAGIPVPQKYENIDLIEDFPVFMKPDQGSGSANARKVESKILCREYQRLNPECTFYEYIVGKEYTVDCFFTSDGRLKAYNQRIRKKNMGGAVVIAQNDYSFDILPYLRKLERSFLIRGCVNFQYILRDEVPYFIDVNLRYASGGLPLTVESGVDIPQMLTALAKGELLSEQLIAEDKAMDGKIMYRYFNEYYEVSEK